MQFPFQECSKKRWKGENEQPSAAQFWSDARPTVFVSVKILAERGGIVATRGRIVATRGEIVADSPEIVPAAGGIFPERGRIVTDCGETLPE
jgi:hypothetical protein